MRSSRSLASSVVKVTAIPAAAVITAAQVLPAQTARSFWSVYNGTDAIISVYLCDKIATPGQGITVKVAIGGYFEDPCNYQGPISFEGGTTGSSVVTEYL